MSKKKKDTAAATQFRTSNYRVITQDGIEGVIVGIPGTAHTYVVCHIKEDGTLVVSEVIDKTQIRRDLMYFMSQIIDVKNVEDIGMLWERNPIFKDVVIAWEKYKEAISTPRPS